HGFTENAIPVASRSRGTCTVGRVSALTPSSNVRRAGAGSAGTSPSPTCLMKGCARCALQNKLARQAIGYAIDYDGIIKNLIGIQKGRMTGEIPSRQHRTELAGQRHHDDVGNGNKAIG